MTLEFELSPNRDCTVRSSVAIRVDVRVELIAII